MLIPLCALVGSGIDLGRVYVAKSRLQMACDAASLAGRRAVDAGATTATVKSEVTKFLNFNFPDKNYGTATLTTSTSVGTTAPYIVTVNTSTTMPMSIMAMFGFSAMPISVTCSAQEDYVNTDIVLVLDITGSMNCAPGASATANCPVEVVGSKMQGMRDAVMAFYKALSNAQDQLQKVNLRLRYGIVPFSSTVNIGKAVYDINPGYIMNPAQYRDCSGTMGNNNYCNTSSLKPGATHDANWFKNTWAGCVEEASSDNTITTSSSYAIPDKAKDLNIDLVPTLGTTTAAQATQWAPFDPSAEEGYASGQYSPCPASAVAKPLQAWTSTDLQTYMNGLAASGGTMTDEGMIWGGRMLSQTGIWASINPATFGNMPVNRFVILMTDGTITAYGGYYGAYGVENLDHRVEANYPGSCGGNGYVNYLVGCDADSYVHRQRFSMVCNEIKNEGVSIWAIGFGQSFTGSATSDDTKALAGCATNSGQVAYVSDSDTLKAKFTAIGQEIGALRLTK